MHVDLGCLGALLHKPFSGGWPDEVTAQGSCDRQTACCCGALAGACSTHFLGFQLAVQVSSVVCAQATVETVIKVSGNKHAEDVKAEKAAEKAEAEKEKEEAERQTAATLPPAAPPPPETVVESIIHHSWGHLSADPKDIPVVRVPTRPLVSYALVTGPMELESRS